MNRILRSFRNLATALAMGLPALLPAILVALPVATSAASSAPATINRADDFPRLAPRLALADFLVDGAPAEALLVVHYRRPAGDYAGWNLWTWPEGGEGSATPFEGEDAFGRHAVVPFGKAPGRAGFLIRRGNWEEKDFDQDRFVALGKGTIAEIWVQSGDAEFTTEPGRVDTSLRVLGAFLDRFDRITLATSVPLDARAEKALEVRVAPADGRGEGRSVKVRQVRPAGASGGRAIHEVVLARKIDADEVGRVRIGFDPKVVPGIDERPAYARDVLDDRAFDATDARLGAFATPRSTRFATWSPVSDRVALLLYEDPARAAPSREIPLARAPRGVWEATVEGDLHGVAYRYRFEGSGERREAPDMHAFAANADSSRSVVADLSRLEPEGFRATPEPRLAQPTDEVLYEIHVRDYSIRDDACDPAHRGTYLGLVHAAPAVDGRASRGLDHLRELGVTAVHLLPVHDFTAKVGEYNWGYWTTLFNVPESNYATDPADPFSAIRDLRTAITRLHASGIRVILDVVYNHTSDAGPGSPFGAAVPHYFFRTSPDGRYLNDSGTGNGVADERPMMRKYVLDSLAHWLREYRVDGFRFDLLGCHRPETVRALCELVRGIRPDATLYGEPWTGGGTIHFGKGAQKGLPIAVFNDHLRNAIRGDLDGSALGFATGPGGDVAAIRRGVAGAIDDFTREPTETVNYASAHDNLILWDKIARTQPDASEATRRAMQKLAHGIVLTSQGIPFLHGGCDFARTKGGNHNSYDAGDDVNDFGWSRKPDFDDVHDFVAGLVRLRREHPAFRMADDADVRRALAFAPTERPVAFTIDGTVAGDRWNRIYVAYNDEPTPMTAELPPGEWTVVVDATRAGVEPLGTVRGRTVLPPYSMLVAHAR